MLKCGQVPENLETVTQSLYRTVITFVAEKLRQMTLDAFRYAQSFQYLLKMNIVETKIIFIIIWQSILI